MLIFDSFATKTKGTKNPQTSALKKILQAYYYLILFGYNTHIITNCTISVDLIYER
ncbi:MAG: hypothetical protein ACFE85_04700 [Candidatus Hodarchaeota archaeon]